MLNITIEIINSCEHFAANRSISYFDINWYDKDIFISNIQMCNTKPNEAYFFSKWNCLKTND